MRIFPFLISLKKEKFESIVFYGQVVAFALLVELPKFSR